MIAPDRWSAHKRGALPGPPVGVHGMQSHAGPGKFGHDPKRLDANLSVEYRPVPSWDGLSFFQSRHARTTSPRSISSSRFSRRSGSQPLKKLSRRRGSRDQALGHGRQLVRLVQPAFAKAFLGGFAVLGGPVGVLD